MKIVSFQRIAPETAFATGLEFSSSMGAYQWTSGIIFWGVTTDIELTPVESSVSLNINHALVQEFKQKLAMLII